MPMERTLRGRGLGTGGGLLGGDFDGFPEALAKEGEQRYLKYFYGKQRRMIVEQRLRRDYFFIEDFFHQIHINPNTIQNQ